MAEAQAEAAIRAVASADAARADASAQAQERLADATRMAQQGAQVAATCAARSGVATTQGEAVHLGMRDRYERDAVDKLMLDWWLLAVAREAGAAQDALHALQRRIRNARRARTYAGAAPVRCSHEAAAAIRASSGRAEQLLTLVVLRRLGSSR